MELTKQIYEEYKTLIEENMEANKAGAFALKDNIERTPLYFRGRCTSKTLQIPKVFSPALIEQFTQIVETTYGIFHKVIAEYLACEDYRRLFPFEKKLEELILIPNLYDCLLPIARFDIFFHEDTGEFYFCEINTDGTSAMNEDRILNEMYIDNPAHQEMLRRYHLESFELFDSWVTEFLSMYQMYEKKTEHPNVAIVDFLDGGTLREFQEFARHFQQAGVNCEVCDIRELTYEDGILYSKTGHRIDAIYRRAVTSDIMSHYDELTPFLSAVKDQNVFLAGSFCTQIIHNKWLFHVLHLERTKRILTDAENAFVAAHIPNTVRFNEEECDKNKVLADKDRYILKPLDSYASNGVYAGVEFCQDEWVKHVNEVFGGDYICQDYCPQYATQNIDFAWGDGTWKPYINMSGLYVYHGKFAGFFSRQSDGGIIASHRNERTVPTYVVIGKR
jgi:glutathionylspermidine synthase